MTAVGNYPQLWGEYVLVRPLGSGGMGTVFLALRSRGDHRLCVIKRLNSDTLSDPERLERFRREADISRTVSHPAIAHTIEFGDFDGEPFIAQEFVDGKTVSQLVAAAAISRRQLEPHAVTYIGEQVARALAYAHQSRIVHRDIAPSNVMVDFDGGVRLIDFGLARRSADHSLTATGNFIGRVAYTAPEVLAGTAANAQTDIYSLGVLLWELLVGRPPAFEELKDQPAPSSRVHARPALSAFDSSDAMTPAPQTFDIPVDLDRLVVRAIDADPNKRFPSADAFADALRALLPESYDAKKELAAFLARCYDVPRERELLRADISDARALVEPIEDTTPGAGRRWVSWKTVATVAGLALGTAAIVRLRTPAPVAAPQQASHPAAVATAPAQATLAAPPSVLDDLTRGTSSAAGTPPPSVSRAISHAKRSGSSPPMPVATKRAPGTPLPDAGLLLDKARDSLGDADFEQASRDAKQVIEIGTPRQKAAAHLILGKVLLFRAKRDKDAAVEFATAVKLDPENSAAADQLAALRRRGVQ